MERDQAMKFMHDQLRLMVQKKGSDLFITANFPPAIKVDGKIMPVSNQILTPSHTAELARSIMNDRQAAEFEATKECNFAISPAGIGRFRTNAFIQQGRVGVVCRTINQTIPTLDGLGMPPVLKDVAMTKLGLVIFVGGTGTGKTTSLAALVDYRNQTSFGHIITVEDPIEYVHEQKHCIITPREIGVDTNDWKPALKNTLRQAPYVILMGEIRDRDTMDYAIAFAAVSYTHLDVYKRQNEYAHILTVEDPIEFVHESKKCLINQREVGPHTLSFANALRSALREDPDVVLVGEMRDLETIRLALTAAETGHLVFATLHTLSLIHI